MTSWAGYLYNPTVKIFKHALKLSLSFFAKKCFTKNWWVAQFVFNVLHTALKKIKMTMELNSS